MPGYKTPFQHARDGSGGFDPINEPPTNEPNWDPFLLQADLSALTVSAESANSRPGLRTFLSNTSIHSRESCVERPQDDPEPLNVIIPMGGIGQRFAKAGYRHPKPLINIVGKPMLCWLIENLNFTKSDTLWLAVNDEIEDEFHIGHTVRQWFPDLDARTVRLRYYTKGASETVRGILVGFLMKLTRAGLHCHAKHATGSSHEANSLLRLRYHLLCRHPQRRSLPTKRSWRLLLFRGPRHETDLLVHSDWRRHWSYYGYQGEGSNIDQGQHRRLRFSLCSNSRPVGHKNP